MSEKNQALIQQNKSHPEYRLYMEVLVSIPPEPNRISRKALATDLGTSMVKLRNSIHTLKKLGYEFGSNPSREIWIKKSSWPQALRNGQIYWDTVNLYGDRHE